ncbi:site-specific integrase [Candidatus Woesearchaeota archaeon]|nr:site-specific integrase [Candidatus Woesearchaeota archaeon]
MTKENITYLEVEEIIDLVRNTKNTRDKILIQILYETGCTVSELTNIKVRDVKLRNKQIVFSENSHAKEKREAHISLNLLNNIKEYLNTRDSTSSHLLSTRQSAKMTPKRIQQLISEYITTKGKITPQILRYTHIAHAYNKGVGISEITKQVGLKRSRAIEIFSQLKEPKSSYNKFLEESPFERI